MQRFPKRRLTETEEKAVLRRYSQGENAAKLCEEFHISRTTLSRITYGVGRTAARKRGLFIGFEG